MKPLTQKKLKQLLDFNEDSGEFLHKRNNGRAKAGQRAGNVNVYGYLIISVNGCRYAAHRLAWLWVHGEMPSLQIDHIDGVKLNNRPDNLRCANHVQNAGNRGISKRNSSGHKGVSLNKASGKWHACIGNGVGKVRSLGYFNQIEQAAAAYRKAATERFGAFARFK
jgi:hypothetical protein